MSLRDDRLSQCLALDALATEFMRTDDADLLGRWGMLEAFWNDRLGSGLDPHFRIAVDRTGSECHILSRAQERLYGINFSSYDYLSLASHPALHASAIEAIGRWGQHSAGPASVQGGSTPSLLLEERLAELLCCQETAVFPSGWTAGYGVIRALVREHDHVVIDTLAHSCLQEGARSATRNVHRAPHGSPEATARRLAAIRNGNATAGILVVTQSLFALDSSVPDLRAIHDACRAYQATLLINVANDIGAIGDGGLGFAGEQGMIGEADIVMGSFAKTFAASGGFVASRSRGLRQALRAFASPLLSSSALSPLQASVILAALDIIRSREGTQRRRQLKENIQRLRAGLHGRAFRVLGHPSGIVPAWLGNLAQARLTTRTTLASGGLVTLVEHPVVSRNAARWLLHVTADHTAEQVDRFIAIAVAAREQTPVSATVPGADGCARGQAPLYHPVPFGTGQDLSNHKAKGT